MISAEERTALARDTGIGAGNFLHKLRAMDRDLDASVLHFGEQWAAPDGTTVTELSLGSLCRLVDGHAGWYNALGVQRRDVVGVQTDTAIDMFVHYLALMSLGAIPALINGNLPVDVLRVYLNRVGTVGIYTGRRQHLALASEPPSGFLLCPNDVVLRPESLPPWYPYVHADLDPVLICHTSGTTGTPKPVLQQHQGSFFGARYRLSMPLGQAMHGNLLSALPPNHNSAIMTLMVALLHDVPIDILSTQDAEVLVREIERFQPTMVYAFAATYAQLAGMDLADRDLRSVNTWWSSGDALHASHAQRIVVHGHHYEARIGGAVRVPGSLMIDSLGSSELGNMHFARTHQQGRQVRPRSLGRPLPFAHAVVVDENDEFLPPYKVGRLGMRSPAVTTGYWNDSAATWRSQTRGYWLTGDYVFRDESGSFYHVDRLTDVVMTPAGPLYSVLAEELTLRAMAEDVVDCTVIALLEGGRTLACALLQLAEGAEPQLAERLGKINEVLGQHGVPPIDVIRQVAADDIAKGVTGKVRKNALRTEWAATARTMP